MCILASRWAIFGTVGPLMVPFDYRLVKVTFVGKPRDSYIHRNPLAVIPTISWTINALAWWAGASSTEPVPTNGPFHGATITDSQQEQLAKTPYY